jgi:hypothetical protein
MLETLLGSLVVMFRLLKVLGFLWVLVTLRLATPQLRRSWLFRRRQLLRRPLLGPITVLRVKVWSLLLLLQLLLLLKGPATW